MLIAGLTGGLRNSCAALAEEGRLIGVCAQERVTRLRGAGVDAKGLPGEALDALLHQAGKLRTDIGRYVMVEPGAGDGDVERLDHHLAHASTAYLSSPFTAAAILVCDRGPVPASAWEGRGSEIRRLDWPAEGLGFAEVYSRAAAAFGFRGEAGDQRLEALARLCPEHRDRRVEGLLRLEDGSVVADGSLEAFIEEATAGERDPGGPVRARLAAALQGRMGELLLDRLSSLQRQVGCENLCLAGDIAYNSALNSLAKRSGPFGRVFVPVDPGHAGLAVGAAVRASGTAPAAVSPFLGPAYSAEQTKEVLDNCKLQYSWESEEAAVQSAVKGLVDGHLVGWFDGPMEWGPRALGARCILANPLAPYVLENLNRFLKRRESWRGYAFSGLEESVAEHFDGPAQAPFMECDYRPRDAGRFRAAMPSPGAAVRVHSVSAQGLPRFRRLLEAFGEATGLPFLVNTSFNGFHEPIVCSPRDAVRVFYGSGLDLLVINQFVLRK